MESYSNESFQDNYSFSGTPSEDTQFELVTPENKLSAMEINTKGKNPIVTPYTKTSSYYSLDWYNIIIFLLAILSFMFLITNAVYFSSIIQSRPPTNNESIFMLTVSILLAIGFMILIIYTCLKIASPKEIITYHNDLIDIQNQKQYVHDPNEPTSF